jgi:hypothetical protein
LLLEEELISDGLAHSDVILSFAEGQNATQQRIGVVVELFPKTQSANVHADFYASIISQDLIVALLVSGVLLQNFPFFNKINQTVFTFYYGSFKSLRAFWHQQSILYFDKPSKGSILE